MDISARNIPAFLVNCGAYHRYLNKALSGEVALPAYEQGTNGVIVIHGEVFCRVAGCDKGQVPTSATNNLRAHLRRHHGMVLARTPVGRLTQVEKDQAVAWYTALFEEHEQDEEEEEEEDEEEDGELEESEDDDYEESGDEDTKEEDEDE